MYLSLLLIEEVLSKFFDKTESLALGGVEGSVAL